MALRLINDKTTKINLEDDDWLEVKEDMSRRDFNRIISTLPVTRDGLDADSIDIETATGFAEMLFSVFVKGWSVKGVDPTVESYQNLTRASSQVIDQALSDHFNSLAVTAEEEQKSA